ncbi:MAG: glycosyl transferase family 2 [Thermoleophilia bacterium]|nr:glycosyl transferase family 2 [Thermoleophilia bacterium]
MTVALTAAVPTTCRVSVVIPCLDEAETIAECVTTARAVLEENGLAGEVIVVDNGSTDDSGNLARAAGALVVQEPRRGYGSAYLAGLTAARGDYIVMVDADLTYDFREIPRFVHELEDGAELVVGNRMRGVRPGAMPWLSRVGNPVLSGFLNALHRTNIRDVHCGMRALRRSILPTLNLRTVGMEFASEMVIRATREQLDVRELPIELHPRVGTSKLSPFRDGWRHLRVIVVYNPTFLFLLPGMVMLVAGSLITLLVFVQAPILGRDLYIHSLIVGCLLILVGVQAIGFGLCARVFGVYFISDKDRLLQRLGARFQLEHGLVLAFILVVTGLALFAVVIGQWASRGFGELSEARLAILAATVIAVGAQVFFTSFLLSILGLRRSIEET